MKVDRAILQERKSLSKVLEALDHNLTARDNFGPEGIPEGWVLTSRGEQRTPSWQSPTIDLGDIDAYSKGEVDTLLAGHTHPASAIISGILNPQRLGTGTSDQSTYLRGDSTWQPRTLQGLGIAGEVAGYAASGLMIDPDCCEPMVIPGPAGKDGIIGRDGAAGPPGIEGESADDWPTLVPGPTGPQGAAGGVGPAGPGTFNNSFHYEEIVSEDWPLIVPGPQGIPGVSSPVQAWHPEQEEFNESLLGALGPGGGALGAGTPGVVAKWINGGGQLGNSVLTETAGPTGTYAGDFYVASGGASLFWVSGTGPHVIWEELGQAADEKRWRMYADSKIFNFQTLNDAFTVATPIWAITRGAGLAVTRMDFSLPLFFGDYVMSQSGGDTTGLIIGRGAANNYQIRTNADLAAGQQDATKPSWAVAIQEGAADNFAIYRMAAGGGGGYVGLWKILNTGNLTCGTDNTLDIGATATTFRPRNTYLAGYCMQPNFRKQVTADQAAFNAVQTNITGLSFAIGANETWLVDITISCTMVSTGGVKFYFTGPAGVTGEVHREGNIATIVTWQSLYQNVLTVPGAPFFITGAVTGTYQLQATIRTAGTAGTIQVVGITSIAATTCVVKKGSLLVAERQA